MTSKHSPQRRLLGAAFLAVSTALVAVATASAVPVRGSLEAPRELPEPTPAEDVPAPYYWEEWNGVLDPQPRRLDLRRELAVVLVGASEGSAPGSAVKLQGGALSPSTMVAQAGSTLRIENTDGCAHELYAEGIDGFGPMQTAPGAARTPNLPSEASVHVIRDRLYPHVEGHLHIVPNLVAHAQIDDGGRYVFADVAEGTYTLKVFYRDREVHSQQVQVEAALTLDPITLNLTAPSE